MRPVVVTHALRTPIGKYLGAFVDLSAADLGAAVVGDLLARAGLDPERVGELIFGNGRQAGGGPNVARQISVRAGLPERVPAWTMNMACGSGLKSVQLAAESIQLGRNDIVVAGGVESMSGLPFFLPKMRTGYRLGHAPVVDAMYQDGFECPLAHMLMGATAEKLAQELSISRDEQDQFALASQQKAAAAIEAGRFADELSPVTVKTKKGEIIVSADEHVRPDTTIESLKKLPAVFAKDNGTVTAGNASGITDGAAALLVMAEDTARELGLEPLAWIGASTQAGVDPTIMGIGPVPALEALRAKSGLSPADFDLIELNEAFAAQVLACHKKLPLPMDRVNVNGGSIALGHPIGATGARICVTLLHEMKRRKVERGLATLCISGGMGIATAFHRTQTH
ncbi:MAG: acetyl-CoA C-acetyltransferase [Planctomycetes bacterium]|nr:acetyl-CoA C-acetyltransferase [Planctomycetota bacterium]